MRNRSRTAAKLAGAFGVLALMATLLGLAPSSAGAAEVPFEFIMQSGSAVNVGDTEFPLVDPAQPTSSGLIGTMDDVTGDFEADLQVPIMSTTQTVTDPPIPGEIELTVAITADPVVGNVDLTTNVVEASTTVDVTMSFIRLVPTSGTPPEIILNIDCTMADIAMELSSDPDGENWDPTANPITFAVAGAGFTFPEPECAWNGQGADTSALVPTVRDGLIENLALPNDDTTAFLDFVAGSPTPPQPPSTTTTVPTTVATTVAPSTAPAAAVRATPRVTG